MTQQELDDTGTAPPPVAAPVALSRPDFTAAVRSALKDLHRPHRLAASPLVGSRVAASGPELARRLRAAVTSLAADPRDRRGARAVDRTFVRAAATQERAAEVLGLPFSTYRRHLAEGLDRVDAVLWSWELHGPPQTPPDQPADRPPGGE